MTEQPTKTHREIDLSPDLSGFFDELVQDAADRRGIEATGGAKSYLTSLLTDYAKPARAEVETLSRPITLLLQEALNAADRRFERLRVLGDGVLYTTGFFRPHLESRGVALAYVGALGALAYDRAATLLRGPEGAEGAPDILRELAANFESFALLLNDVADALLAQSAQGSAQRTLDLYESWLRSGSTPLAKALVERGLIPQHAQPGPLN